MKPKVNMLFSHYNFHESWAKETMSHYIKKTDRVVIIPFSFGDHINDLNTWNRAYGKGAQYYNEIINPFLAYGINENNIIWINYFSDHYESSKNKIENSDIIFLTGGYPDKMMTRLKEFQLIHILENFIGIIIGSSAGAMIQLANYHITPDDDYESFTYQTGLSIITDFDIEVHYDRSENQNDYITKVLKEKIDTVYAITNQGGIIVSNEEVTLLGDVCIMCM